MALAPRLPPGSIFARDYEVVDLLAEGGMGAVYRAVQRSTRKLRALKLVSTRLASDPKGRQRFVREATVGASIDSEHVVEVIGAGIDEETQRPWLAMELLDGADLGAVLRHQGPLSPGQLRALAEQLCHGLAAAHRAGVVHRDLKPANVFIARSRRAGVPFTVKILDFGIAKVVQESGTGATETDTVGSPLWMAPEQLNAQRPTPATDVWALGLLAFWALTGKHYWKAAHSQSSTVQALFVEQLFKPLVAPSDRAPEVRGSATLPEGFDAWFLRCLDREPDQRYADAREAGDALIALLPEDREAAARLLPDEPLRPSIEVTDTQDRHGHDTTVAAEATAWDSSAVLPEAALASVRDRAEDEATRVEPMGLGADLSRAPLPDEVPRAAAPRRSMLGLMSRVAMLVSLLAISSWLAWSWLQEGPDASTSAGSGVEAATEPAASATTEADADGGTEVAASGGALEIDTDGPSEATGGPGVPHAPGGPDPALALVVPRRTQLTDDAHEIDFLGWSAAGHRFALKAEYREEDRNRPNRLTLIQVHDALSGVMIDSYLVSREAGPAISDYSKLSRAASEASPEAEWSATKRALGLDKRAPRRSDSRGGRLHIEAGEPPAGTRIAFPPTKLGAAYRWSGFEALEEVGAGRWGPTITIDHEGPSARWPLLSFEPPFRYGELASRRTPEGDEPAVAGRILAYWSPTGDRVVLLVESDARPESDPPLHHRRWALRAAGPQIRLVEAGAGQRRTREIAAELAAAGLTVAVAELRAPPVAKSSLHYRRDRDPAKGVAARIHEVLPMLPAPVAKRTRGFTEVTITLGQDVG